MFYGTSNWDPVLIVAQIVTVQCLYYICLGSLLYFLASSSQARVVTIASIFDYRFVTTSTALGWSVIFSFLGASFTGALVLYFVVERTKKCLDFTVTCYCFHALFSTFYKGFPLSFEWWFTICLSAGITALVGESLCMKKEMRDIPISTRPTTSRNVSKRQRLIHFLAGQ
jgi:hypothetical protein